MEMPALPCAGLVFAIYRRKLIKFMVKSSDLMMKIFGYPVICADIPPSANKKQH